MSAIANLGLDVNSIVLYIVNFGIIFFFVSKYLSGPIVSMLEKRSKKIKESLEEIDKLKREIEKNKKELQESKEKSIIEMNAKIAKMNRELDAKFKEAMLEAENERQKMLSSAEHEISLRKEKLLDEVKDEIRVAVYNMVNYIVANKIPEDVVRESVAEAWTKYLSNK